MAQANVLQRVTFLPALSICPGRGFSTLGIIASRLVSHDHTTQSCDTSLSSAIYSTALLEATKPGQQPFNRKRHPVFCQPKRGCLLMLASGWSKPVSMGSKPPFSCALRTGANYPLRRVGNTYHGPHVCHAIVHFQRFLADEVMDSRGRTGCF